jgi:isocitrate lyase
VSNSKDREIKEIEAYLTNERFAGIKRPHHGAEEVWNLRGSTKIEHTLAQLGCWRLWEMLNSEPFVRALGAVTGNQAVQMVQGGLKSIYASGWQVAADANSAQETYPDQSLYPADSCPALVRRINNALTRADQIDWSEGRRDKQWFAPIVADAEAGFGGNLNAFEIMKAMIHAGAAAVHFEDQLSSAKKCGHLGGKVVIPTNQFVQKLASARLASDILGVPTIIIARTDAMSAKLIANGVDEHDRIFIEGEQSSEGFFKFNGGIEAAIARGLIYAQYADMIWCETPTPDLNDARRFAEEIHAKFPGKLLAYNCSPSFKWRKYLRDVKILNFQESLGEMGYKFQFVTLAGFHVLNLSMFDLAERYSKDGMLAYVDFQEKEFETESRGYRATKHQQFVGTGYFDKIQLAISGEDTETVALKGSTEKAQF